MVSKHNLREVITKKQIASRTLESNLQLANYKIRAINLWKRTPALQQMYLNPEDSEFSKYIDTEAMLYCRELQECGVAFPSWQDMLTVGGETDLRLFLQIGRGCYQDIVKYFNKKTDTSRVLDFGVGCGRTARHFYNQLPEYEIHGCDVDSTPIEFIYNNIPFIQPLQSSNKPPLPYETNTFDAIYSVSVFSHLKESAFFEWANELSRILKPGGVLVITIHGLHALDIMRARNNPASIGIDEKTFNSTESKFDQDGFIWMPQVAGSSDIDTSQYGISFIDKNRIQKHLPQSLKITHYGEGEIGNWQDLIALEKINES